MVCSYRLKEERQWAVMVRFGGGARGSDRFDRRIVRDG